MPFMWLVAIQIMAACTSDISHKEARPALCDAIPADGWEEMRALAAPTEATTRMLRDLHFFWDSTDAENFTVGLALPPGEYAQKPDGWVRLVTHSTVQGYNFKFSDGMYAGYNPYQAVLYTNAVYTGKDANGRATWLNGWRLNKGLAAPCNHSGGVLAFSGLTASLALETPYAEDQTWAFVHNCDKVLGEGLDDLRGEKTTLTPFGVLAKPDPGSTHEELIEIAFERRKGSFFLSLRVPNPVTDVVLEYKGKKYQSPYDSVNQFCPQFIPDLEALFPDLETLLMLDRLPRPTSIYSGQADDCLALWICEGHP